MVVRITETQKATGEYEAGFTVAVSEKGVSRIAFDGQKDAVTWVWLKLPLKHGESWSNGLHELTAFEREEVETPVGKFHAIPVKSFHPSFGNSTCWLASGVGPVLVRCGERRSYVLKSFTPVKD